MTQFKSLAFLWSIATEGEDVRNRNVEKLITSDPVMAAMGGACAFIFTKAMSMKARSFLEEYNGQEDAELRTNNPDLLKDLKTISQYPTENTYLTVFSTKLQEMLTPEEFEAVVQHENGHVFHRHLEKTQWVETHDTFLNKEEEADNHATKDIDPSIMISALEKCMKFGSEQSVLWSHGASDSWIRKLMDTDILDAMTIKKAMVLAMAVHGRRFKTLQRLKKQRDAGNAPAPRAPTASDDVTRSLEKRIRVAKTLRENPETIKGYEDELAKRRAKLQ
jgi:hypothetical protein